MQTIIVLGGGIAGLAATRELASCGFHVVLLEARPRFGGRILTHPRANGGVPIELGAEFVHGRDPALWELLESIPLPAREVPNEHRRAQPDGTLRPDSFRERIQKVTDGLDPRLPDETVARFLGRKPFPPEVKGMALDHIQNFHAADPERFGVHALAAAEDSARRLDGERQFRIISGYDTLVQWFEHELHRLGVDLVLNAEAKRLRWERSRVAVEALVDGGPRVFRGSAAVVTLPLAVLQAEGLAFDPAIPEKQEAIAALEAGQVTKVILRFRDRFWPDRFGFLHASDDWLPIWWTNDDPLTLTGWAGGPKGARGAELKRAFLLDRAVDSLANIFRCSEHRVREKLVEFHTHNWREDPFTRMAYSYVPVHQLEAPRRLAEPVAETLFFAGEATSLDGQNGTVHGALNSGLRAAGEAAHGVAFGRPEAEPTAGRNTRSVGIIR